MTARFIVADVFDGLASLEDNSVDLVFGSPPFLALRSYLPADHPLKGKEIGSEATPADFLDTLLDVVEACDRVLAPHGSLCFELGDTFAGSGGAGGDYTEGGLREGQPEWTPQRLRKAPAGSWPMDKSLAGIPTLFAWSLAYGRNLLCPERETPRWRIRNLTVWCRPNPPVGALGDKWRPATSYLTVATKARDRYFDLDAVRGEAKTGNRVLRQTTRSGHRPPEVRGPSDLDGEHFQVNNPAGAPPLDYWVIPTQPYTGAHYATFPTALVIPPIRSMCPQRVCRVCGEPSRRITDATYEQTQATNNPSDRTATTGVNGMDDVRFAHGRANKVVETLGWTDCGCINLVEMDQGQGWETVRESQWRPGCVLDPFAGSGTTLAVATGHGRDAIGIDLDSRNVELALERVGPLLMTVETLTSEPAA